jgi:hypothetical protein
MPGRRITPETVCLEIRASICGEMHFKTLIVKFGICLGGIQSRRSTQFTKLTVNGPYLCPSLAITNQDNDTAHCTITLALATMHSTLYVKYYILLHTFITAWPLKLSSE